MVKIKLIDYSQEFIKKIFNNEMIEISENGSSSKLSPIFFKDLVDITEKFLKNKWQGNINSYDFFIRTQLKILQK